MGYFVASASRLRAAAVVAVMAVILGVVPVVGALAGPAGPAYAAGSSGSTGYWLAGTDGNGDARGTTNVGSLRGVKLNRPVVGGSPTADGLGTRF